MSEKKRWESIDFIKGIACIAIVLIHFNFPGEWGVMIKSTCKFAVPVFFFTSGFFVEWIPQERIDANKIVKKVKHIFVIIISSAITYAVFTVMYRWITNEEQGLKTYILETISATKVINFFMTNDPFLYGHLWFLLALIYCYMFIMFVTFKSPKSIGVLGMGLMLSFLFLTVYQSWVPIPGYIKISSMGIECCLYNLFVFRALGFFLIGMFCKINVNTLTSVNINDKLLTCIAIVGSILAICERFWLVEAQFYLGSYITFLALVTWAVRNPQKGNVLIIYIGRELSLYIYVLHIAVGKVINLILNKNFGEGHHVCTYFSTLLILGTSILISFGINLIWKSIKTLCAKRNIVDVIEG